jgi:hypothetical protein
MYFCANYYSVIITPYGLAIDQKHHNFITQYSVFYKNDAD